MSTNAPSEPSQLSAALSSAQGAAYSVRPPLLPSPSRPPSNPLQYTQAIGTLTGSTDYTTDGERLSARGEEELKEARERQKREGEGERVEGKVQSCVPISPSLPLSVM
jgi:hypothetical protein